MSKYQYLQREYVFRFLGFLPLWVRRLAVRVFVKKKSSWLNTLETPAQLILYITNRCNARCSHCFYWKQVARGRKNELSLSQLKKIAKSLKNPLSTLSITGGEPFIRSDLAEICYLFCKFNKTRKINIVSNGYYIARIIKTTKEILRNCPVDLNIQISLDGLRETHDKIRKILVFDNAVKTIKQLESLSKKHKNFQVTVQTTIIKDNLQELVKLARFVKEEFPSVHHGFQFVRSASFDVYNIDKKILSGLDTKLQAPLLSLREMKDSQKKISLFTDKSNLLLSTYVKVMNEGIIKMKEEKKPFVKCLAGKYDGVVWPDGKVSVCEFTKSFASLREFGFCFYKLWQSKKADLMRKKTSRCFCTHTCNLLNAMQFNSDVLLEILNKSLLKK